MLAMLRIPLVAQASWVTPQPLPTTVAFHLDAFLQTSAIKCNCYSHRVEVEFILRSSAI